MGYQQILPACLAARAQGRDPRAANPAGRPRPLAKESRLRSAHFVSSGRPKITLYSHDTCGLGNIRRTLLLAQELTDAYPGAPILILTGSPMIHSFRIPDGVDYVKLPCVDRVDAEEYEPRFLSECVEEVRRTRSSILRGSILNFSPDLLIVDKRPSGVDGELLETLVALRDRGSETKLVLGVRDILDEPARTRRVLRENGSFEIVERFYDEVWIYGAQSVFDTVREYDFPSPVAQKCVFCGYLKRPTQPPAKAGGPPRVLVTTGGGGDGSAMITAYLEGLSRLPRCMALRSTVVFGPEMPEARRAALLERFGYLADVDFIDFLSDMTPLYAEADVVISMAGYNTVCELLSFASRGILVPRAEPVREQLIRARLLSARGLFDVVEPHELSGEFLINKVLAKLQTPPAAREYSPDLNGLPRIRERVRTLLQGVPLWAAAV